MSKGKWKQVDGDRDWSGHGSVFARDDGGGVDVWKLDSWANLDSSAIPTHGLYVYDEGYYSYEDLQEGWLPGEFSKDVKSALQSIGMDEQEYAKLDPIYKAAVRASVESLDSSTSTSNLLKALPTEPEDIEFHSGKETTKSVTAANQSERQDAVRDHFESRMSAGEWPDDEAFDFAFGDEDFEMELKGTDEAAFDYAMIMAGIKKHGPNISIDKDDFQKVVMALWEAPYGEEMSKGQMAKAANAVGVENDDEALQERLQELTEAAQSLASSMMEVLGFEWI